MNVSEGFSPAGLKVLVVDDDPVCLLILEQMLRQCSYSVTTCQTAALALSLLRENRSAFDLVMSDVHMPDMDGFQLLEAIGLELDLPVIMMSANGETGVVMKGIIHGACDYLLKPVRIEELRNIWQHVIRRRGRGGDAVKDEQQAREWDEAGRGMDSPGESDSVSRKRKEKLGSLDDPLEDGSSLKKARVVWSVELHQQFVNAVNQLGIEKAVPKRILEIMNVQGLSRENVASHLQKYRQYLKRLSGVSTQPYPVASFHAAQEGSFAGTMQIQPGGRGVAAAAASCAKGLNIPMSGSGLDGLSRIDPATLSTLAQLRAHQHQQLQGEAVASQRYGGVNQWHTGSPSGSPNALPNVAFAGLQRMNSSELDMLMRVAAHDSLTRQRQEVSTRCDVSVGLRSPVYNVPPIPTGLSSYKREDELDIGLAQVAVAGSDQRTPSPYGTIAHGGSQDKLSEPAYNLSVGDFDAAALGVQNASSDIGVSILKQVLPHQSSDGGLHSFMPSSPELNWTISHSENL